MKRKVYLSVDVYTAALDRVSYIINHFNKNNYYVAFSGGKDSGVLLNMVIEQARIRNQLPVRVLYVDMEAQYQHTLDYIYQFAEKDEVVMDWVCLPLSLRNASSQFEPKWLCWDPERQDKWLRDWPKVANSNCNVITDLDAFPFFKLGMEFEDFVYQYGVWLTEQNQSAVIGLLGIRSDESLNRYLTIKNEKKNTFNNKSWTTEQTKNFYLGYPIYDWHVNDIWLANYRFNWPYNYIYDLMHKAGVPLSKQRLCQPFGDDQRQGLWLYQILEPQTWEKLVARVEGCNFGARYSKTQGHILGYYRFNLPEGYTYRAYSKFLLNSMPPHLANHYRERIFKFILWWKKNGKAQGVYSIPDMADKKLESQRKVPSWRRICKVLIKNDYWCRGLSFSASKRLTDHYIELYTNHMGKESING